MLTGYGEMSCSPNRFSEALQYSIGVAAFQRPDMPRGFSELQKWLRVAEAVLGPLQIALFALALRMRLKR